MPLFTVTLLRFFCYNFDMDAKPYLDRIAERFAALCLDAVMIGNAAAAINGAPVTTLDVDFMVEQTPENFRKLAVLAQQMNCQFVEHPLRIASLDDILASKKAAARPKDLASIPILEMTIDEKRKQTNQP